MLVAEIVPQSSCSKEEPPMAHDGVEDDAPNSGLSLLACEIQRDGALVDGKGHGYDVF